MENIFLFLVIKPRVFILIKSIFKGTIIIEIIITKSIQEHFEGILLPNSVQVFQSVAKVLFQIIFLKIVCTTKKKFGFFQKKRIKYC